MRPCQAFSDDVFDEWNPDKLEETVHIFTSELEVVTLGPNRGTLLGGDMETDPMQLAQEKDPFDTLDGRMPTVEEQGLCIGATFGIKAFNAVDPSRQINVLGFCR